MILAQNVVVSGKIRPYADAAKTALLARAAGEGSTPAV
jgi:hypothetical protein